LDKTKIEYNLNRINPDIIINCVALANVDLCETNKKLAKNLNIDVIKNVIEFKKQSTWLIHFSTDHVYDQNQLNLEDETKITNYYSKTKLESEKYVLENKGLVLRTNFFGRSSLPYKKSFNEWILYNLKNNIKFKLVKDIFFSPVSLDTLKIKLEMIINKCYFLDGIYNLGSSSYMSKYNFALKVMQNYGSYSTNLYDKIRSDELFKTYRPKFMQMNNNKISKIIGDLPTLEEEIDSLKNGD
jgi:dTDP-4-dehydrorhamnose reductase